MIAKAKCWLEPIASEFTQEGRLGLPVPPRRRSAHSDCTSNASNTVALRKQSNVGCEPVVPRSTLPQHKAEKCRSSSRSRLTLPSRGRPTGYALRPPLMSNVRPQMTNRVGLLLILTVLGSFVAAVLLGLFASEARYPIGALLVGAGSASFVFSQHLAAVQQRLSEEPLIPRNWNNVRPLTFKLWGTGLVILGVLQLSGL